MSDNVRTQQGRLIIELSMNECAPDDCGWAFSVVDDCFDYIGELERKLEAYERVLGFLGLA